MPYQNISAEASDADLQAVKTALETVRQKLPFLVTLTPAERRHLFKMGDKSLAFVQNSLQAARNNPGILPAKLRSAGIRTGREAGRRVERCRGIASANDLPGR